MSSVRRKISELIEKPQSGEWGKDDEAGRGIPVIRTANFTDGGVINYTNIVTRDIPKEKVEKKGLKTGDIIIEKSGGSDTKPVGRVVFYDGPDHKYLFNNFTAVLRVKDVDLIKPKYLFYYLFDFYWKKGTLQFENKTTGLHNLKLQQMIDSVEIPIKSIEEQNLIVETIEKVESIVSQKKEQLDKLDELIKSRFIELFGDPVVNEKRWDTKPLLEMGSCKNGMNFHYEDAGVEINCLGVGDFKDYSIISDTSILPTVSLNEMPSTDYLLQNDDIVFVRSNGNKALVGRSVAVYPGDIPTTFSGFCIRYRKTDEAVNIPYLLRVLKTESVRQKMAGRGANIQNLNQQILGALIIPVPPIELQNQFAAFVDQVDKSKLMIQKSLEEVQMLRDSLMQKYFG